MTQQSAKTLHRPHFPDPGHAGAPLPHYRDAAQATGPLPQSRTGFHSRFSFILSSTIRQLRSALQLSIAARLAISFIAVAVLVVVANVIVDNTVSVVHTTEVRRAPSIPAPAVIVPAAAPIPVREQPAPAPEPPLPSADPVLHSIEQFEQALQKRTELDSDEAAARLQLQAGELSQAIAAYAAASRTAGTAPPARLHSDSAAYVQLGTELIDLADARRKLLHDYSICFEQLNTRAKQSLDHAWKIFGRVVARQSLMQLAARLDELRRRYTEFISAPDPDPPTYDRLSASEAAVGKTLAQDRVGFARSEGEAWYQHSREDLDALSATRAKLQELDKQRNAGASKLAEEAAALAETLARNDAAAAMRARKSARTARQAERSPAAESQLSVAQAPPLSSVPGPAAPPAFPAADTLRDRNISATETKPQDPSRRTFVAWISAGVLLLVIYISVGTVLSILRPVRRLLKATASIAAGDTAARVPRGGIRELDTLALAFNAMAEQLATAQGAARNHQQLLEAKVMERTRQLQELAERDPLTGLANRRQLFLLLDASLRAAAAQHRYVGIYFLDIDNFKNLNDSLGHAFGDRVLQAIAQRLAHAAAAFGFAARLGGDEFTVVHQSAGSIEEIRAAGMHLVQSFQQALQLDGREVIASISIGASVFPDHEHSPEALLRAADAALFRAKALGRSQLALFAPELLEAAASKFSTEQGLRRALERGEFELAFQPEVNLQTGETELVEALLRWRMPDGRLALPGDFLAVAEESGLIMQISDWVLRTAIETTARWHHGAWPDARTAINVSSRQLFDSGFIERVKGLLAEFKLPPRCIEIELTETVLQTGHGTIEALHQLKSHGIAIALDDFGTGFSSLASLEQLPLNRIKLDRSLVASIDTSPRSAAIARAIVGLCHSLQLVITAEGIERPEQLACFTPRPDVYAQGYLLSYPLPADELLPALQNIPKHARALLHAGLVRLPESRLAEELPLIGSTVA